MRENKENPVLITIAGKDTRFVARVPLWKAYLILADIEKHQDEIKKLQDKREKFSKGRTTVLPPPKKTK